jgi:acyl carrier protein
MASKEAHMNIEEQIKRFITSEILSEDQSAGLGDDDALISSGRVDSMGLLQILGYVQQQFGVDLMAVGGPMDFDSVSALAAAVRRNQGDN